MALPHVTLVMKQHPNSSARHSLAYAAQMLQLNGRSEHVGMQLESQPTPCTYTTAQQQYT
jgi:hypothetical protein